MSVLYDYFVALSDEDAAAMAEDGPDGELLLVETKGLDPHGFAGPAPRVIAAANEGCNLVLALDDALRDSPAAAAADIAEAWATRGGLTDRRDVEALTGLLREIGELARDARECDGHLYCWWAL